MQNASARAEKAAKDFISVVWGGESVGQQESAPATAPKQPMSGSERRRAFKQIIVKCVLQLLLIETTHELLQNEEVYRTMPAPQLLRLTGVLEDSYQFSKRFNADKDLRVALWKVGFMKQLPNLRLNQDLWTCKEAHVCPKQRLASTPRTLLKPGHVKERST